MEHRKKPTALQCLAPNSPDFQCAFFTSVFCCFFWFLVACFLLVVCRDDSNHHISLSSNFNLEATVVKTEEKLGQLASGGYIMVPFLKGFMGAIGLLVPCVLIGFIIKKPRGRGPGSRTRPSPWPAQPHIISVSPRRRETHDTAEGGSGRPVNVHTTRDSVALDRVP